MIPSFTLDVSCDLARAALATLRTRAEHLTFFLAEPTTSRAARCVDEIPLEARHVDGSRLHVGLTEAGRAHVLQRATRTNQWLMEVHSHGALGDPAEFSLTDREGLAAWVPHLRWRLPLKGYIALVVGSSTVDGLTWMPDSREPLAVDSLHLGRGQNWRATGLSYETWIGEVR